MTENKRIGRNIGRIELLALLGEVKAMLESGYDRKKIYNRLQAENRLTMSYPTFCYQLKQLSGQAVVTLPPSQAQKLKSSGPPKVTESEPFSINRNPKLEDFNWSKT